MAKDAPPSVKCRSEVEQILLSAQAIAETEGRGGVTCADLLEAFIHEGGGEAGALLRAAGLTLESLTSRVFQEDGSFDLARFDALAGQVLEGAVACARNKSHPIIGRRHLIYSMLCITDSTLAGLARAQGQDSESLAGILYASWPSGRTIVSEVEARAAHVAGDLMRILCTAEAEAKDRGEETISEFRLFRALARDGGGEAGIFLAQNGLKWHKLD
jgi:ATP-dependent Clp protease ATP-binding subunit ClpA